MASDFRLKDQLPNITDQIVQTYDDLGTINHLGTKKFGLYQEATVEPAVKFSLLEEVLIMTAGSRAKDIEEEH